MKKEKVLFFVFCFSFFVSAPAVASYISLNTTVTSKVEGNNLDVMVSAINKGDEAAHNVQAEIRAGGKKILAAKMPVLGIDETYKTVSTFKLNFKNPGQYPLVVVMHYADANQYPFSALTVQTFPYQTEALPSDIFGQMKGDSFWREGKLKLTLKNMGDAEIAASTYLVTPRELSVLEDKSQESVISAKSETQIVFPIKNFSALNGSSYQVFAVTQFDKEGLHQASVTPAMAKIVEIKEIFGISYTVIIAFLVVLLLLFIAAQFIKKK